MLLLFAILGEREKGGKDAEGNDKERKYIVRPVFAMEASNLVLVLMLGMTYCILAPVIMFACLAFFLATTLIYGWLFLYVYTPEYDCHGEMWYNMFFGSLWGLLLGMASMAAMVNQKAGAASAVFGACVLLVVFILALLPYFHYAYACPARHMPLVNAREIDRMCEWTEVESMYSSSYYVDPIIKGESQGNLSSASGSCFGCCGKKDSDGLSDEELITDPEAPSTSEQTISEESSSESGSESTPLSATSHRMSKRRRH